jgi:hypothetical protein
VQRGHLAQVEQLELRDHLRLLAEAVEVDDERPRVEEHLVAEVDGAHGERARVRARLQHPQSLLEGVVDRASGRQLHHHRGLGAQGVHRVAEQPRVEAGLVLGVTDVDVDETGAGGLAATPGLDQLVERGGQCRSVPLGGLGAGRSHGDQGRRCRRHAAMVPDLARTGRPSDRNSFRCEPSFSVFLRPR